jgi:hypothetical protein
LESANTYLPQLSAELAMAQNIYGFLSKVLGIRDHNLDAIMSLVK